MSFLNHHKKSDKNRRGFTIIEVALFLAISSALFAAVIGTTMASVYRNRYTDAVNDVVAYLRSVYASVINVENVRAKDEDASKYCTITSLHFNEKDRPGNKDTDNFPGRTNCAIYGKLITFNEGNDGKARSYDVIGTIADKNISIDDRYKTDDAVLSQLLQVGANVITVSSNNCSLNPAGQYSEHEFLWSTQLQNPSGTPYTAAILIIRSPLSGTIHTYKYVNPHPSAVDPTLDTINVQKYMSDNNNPTSMCSIDVAKSRYPNKDVVLANELVNFRTENAYMCVGSDEQSVMYSGGARRGIRIKADGQNASAVELLELDAVYNAATEEGNPCL